MKVRVSSEPYVASKELAVRKADLPARNADDALIANLKESRANLTGDESYTVGLQSRIADVFEKLQRHRIRCQFIRLSGVAEMNKDTPCGTLGLPTISQFTDATLKFIVVDQNLGKVGGNLQTKHSAVRLVECHAKTSWETSIVLQ